MCLLNFPGADARIWLYTQYTDMRKSFGGLRALVKTQLGEDPLSGQLFVFVNRRKTYLKVLYYAQGGYCLWCKQLTQGQFPFALSQMGKRPMNYTELQLLLEGIEIVQARYAKRYDAAQKRHRTVDENGMEILTKNP